MCSTIHDHQTVPLSLLSTPYLVSFLSIRTLHFVITPQEPKSSLHFIPKNSSHPYSDHETQVFPLISSLKPSPPLPRLKSLMTHTLHSPQSSDSEALSSLKPLVILLPSFETGTLKRPLVLTLKPKQPLRLFLYNPNPSHFSTLRIKSSSGLIP